MLGIHYLRVLFRVITFLLSSLGCSTIFSTFSVKLEYIIFVDGYLNSCKINSIALSHHISFDTVIIIILSSIFISILLFCPYFQFLLDLTNSIQFLLPRLFFYHYLYLFFSNKDCVTHLFKLAYHPNYYSPPSILFSFTL